jgi:hypothetical protein
LSKVVIGGDLKMVDWIQIKRIGRWRDEDRRYKFVKVVISGKLKMVDRI